MIFEEDRFADAVEEEIQIKVYNRKDRYSALASKFLETNDFFTDSSTGADELYKSLRVPEESLNGQRRQLGDKSTAAGTPRRRPKGQDSSRLQISHMLKSDRFDTAPSPTDNPAGPCASPNAPRTYAGIGFSANHTDPAPAVRKQQPSKAFSTTAPSTTISDKSDNCHITTSEATAGQPLPPNNSSMAAPQWLPAVVSGPRPQPISPRKKPYIPTSKGPSTVSVAESQRPRIPRKPLAVRDTDSNTRNIMITSYDYFLGKESARAVPKEGRGASSLLRKLTLQPKRPPPAPPSQEEHARVVSQSSEIKQNWFMKMLNPQQFYVSKPAKRKGTTKTLFSAHNVSSLRHIIIEVLEEWQQYGISNIVEDIQASTIRAVISSRNVLSMRSSRFCVTVSAISGGAEAVFTQERGSSTSFMRFLGELERALDSMAVLSPPRANAQVPA
jgi:hypothetical protein